MKQQDTQQQPQQPQLDEFMLSCHKFNRLAGKDNKPTILDLKQQLALIKEELEETIRDLDAKDWVGVLDGYTDIAVTWAGFGQMLDNLQFDTKSALLATADNNLTKFVSTQDTQEILDTINKYKDQVITVELHDDRKFYAFKDINNKVKKPFSFVSNNLEFFVPTNLNVADK